MEDFEKINGAELAEFAMRQLWESDEAPPKPTHLHGGFTINGHWAFETLQRGRKYYKKHHAAKGLPEFSSGNTSYDSQTCYFADDTSISTQCGDAYEAYLHQALVLVRLIRSAVT